MFREEGCGFLCCVAAVLAFETRGRLWGAGEVEVSCPGSLTCPSERKAPGSSSSRTDLWDSSETCRGSNQRFRGRCCHTGETSGEGCLGLDRPLACVRRGKDAGRRCGEGDPSSAQSWLLPGPPAAASRDGRPAPLWGKMRSGGAGAMGRESGTGCLVSGGVAQELVTPALLGPAGHAACGSCPCSCPAWGCDPSDCRTESTALPQPSW